VGVLNGEEDPAERACPESFDLSTSLKTSYAQDKLRRGANPGGERLERVVQEKAVDTIVYSVNDGLSDDFLAQMLTMRFQGVEVCDMPRFYGQLVGKIPALAVNAAWLLNSVNANPYLSSPFKRLFDLFLAVIGMALSFPIFPLIAIAIKLDSKGPVLFRHQRMGLNLKPFTVLKFRTMIQDAEARFGPLWAQEDDPRITRVGRLLRKSRLDELPQLINVLKGEMSFVGFRPLRKHFADELSKVIPFYYLRFTIKPGLTGWPQVKYNYADSEEGHLEKFQYEMFYIQNASLFLDIYIVLKTVQTILFRWGQ
jgi:exopolysaccharide biosynthesis polyprenyl glycosylphosphotransferase